MKVYGIKDATGVVHIESVDVLDVFPSPTISSQGQVIFKRGDGLYVFIDGAWVNTSNTRQPRKLELKPTFMFNGTEWDASEAGQAALMRAVQRVALYGTRPMVEPARIRAANGDIKLLDAKEVTHLALAMFDHLNLKA